MKIYNVDEHKACYCYDGGKEPLIEPKEFESRAKGEIMLQTNELVFIMKGSIDITLRDYRGGRFNKGNILFLPAGEIFNYEVFRKSKILIVRLKDSIHLCHTYGMEQLYTRINDTHKPENLTPLEINVRLQHFIAGLTEAWYDGLKCRKYFEAKIAELLVMIRAYYSEKLLYQFFYPILSPDTVFSEFVRLNWLKHGNVRKLSEAMNITVQQFTKRFNSVFGQTPYKWMQQEKARLIYMEVCQNKKPLKEIAWDYGFSAYTHFSRFCREAYKMTPAEIRKSYCV